MRSLISLILIFTTSLCLADNSPTAPYELQAFKMDVFAQTFKPVKAKANGNISLEKCTQSQDKALNLWCYRVDTKIKIAEVHQFSKFANSESTITPWYMEQNERVFWKKTFKSVEFDNDSKKITTNFDKQTKEKEFKGPIYDDVSYPLQIQKHILRGESEFALNIVSGHKIKKVKFKVLGKATLFTKAGILDTIKVEQTSSNSKVIFWLAKRWNYLPVQFETYKSNKLQSRVTATSVKF